MCEGVKRITNGISSLSKGFSSKSLTSSAPQTSSYPVSSPRYPPLLFYFLGGIVLRFMVKKSSEKVFEGKSKTKVSQVNKNIMSWENKEEFKNLLVMEKNILNIKTNMFHLKNTKICKKTKPKLNLKVNQKNK